jgi:hypothetical protein
MVQSGECGERASGVRGERGRWARPASERARTSALAEEERVEDTRKKERDDATNECLRGEGKKKVSCFVSCRDAATTNQSAYVASAWERVRVVGGGARRGGGERHTHHTLAAATMQPACTYHSGGAGLPACVTGDGVTAERSMRGPSVDVVQRKRGNGRIEKDAWMMPSEAVPLGG